MPTAPATGDTTARTVEDQVLDLICSDPDLLAAEFDAIIAEEWSEPPADRPARGAAGRHPALGKPAQPDLSTAGSPGHGIPASADGHGNAHPRRDTRHTTGRKAGDRHT